MDREYASYNMQSRDFFKIHLNIASMSVAREWEFNTTGMCGSTPLECGAPEWSTIGAPGYLDPEVQSPKDIWTLVHS